ncbi:MULTISPECIES: hypothetical protein [Salipiger]|uniref:hypothetical protein n=1 Tax=Salipiger TaxID=263377 RepID=UPI0019D191B2|nr:MULTISPECIES: hypothetical protein [Salipiger]
MARSPAEGKSPTASQRQFRVQNKSWRAAGATARMLAAEGVIVGLAARRLDRLDAPVTEIEATAA